MAKNYIERQEVEPWGALKTIGSFWTRRFFRIAPLYYVLLIFAFSFGEVFGHYRDVIATAWPDTQTETSRYNDSSFLNIITHISFVFGFLPYYSFRTVLPDWSIGLEMQYYALFPFIMLLIMRVGFVMASLIIMIICIVASYAAPGYFSQFPMPSMILFKLPLFIAGMLIYKSISENKRLYLLVALLAPVSAIAMGYFISPIRMVIECGIILSMAMLLNKHSRKSMLGRFVIFIKKILSVRFSQFLGDVSYSVYLLHLMVVIPVIGLLVQYPGYVELPSVLRFLSAVILSVPVTYLIALILFRHIEIKGIALGRKIIKKRVIESVGNT